MKIRPSSQSPQTETFPNRYMSPIQAQLPPEA